MSADYDVKQAARAQKEYCERSEVPQFAPDSGECERCHRNIYKAAGSSSGIIYGISVEQAGRSLITCCPHCHHSFVE